MLGLIPKTERRPMIRDIAIETAREFKISLDELKCARRFRDYVTARHIAMFIVSRNISRSLPRIAGYFGGRDHTTALHGIRAMQRRAENEADVHRRITTICARVARRCVLAVPFFYPQSIDVWDEQQDAAKPEVPVELKEAARMRVPFMPAEWDDAAPAPRAAKPRAVVNFTPLSAAEIDKVAKLDRIGWSPRGISRNVGRPRHEIEKFCARSAHQQVSG